MFYKSFLILYFLSIAAKVAAHVVEYYNLALEALTKNSGESGYIADTIGSKLYKVSTVLYSIYRLLDWVQQTLLKIRNVVKFKCT